MDEEFGYSACPQVRFLVRGREFVAPLDTVTYLPDSYLSWLVANHAENVQDGTPITVDRHPKVFKRLLERMSQLKEMQIQFHRPETPDSTERRMSEEVCAPRSAMDPRTFPRIDTSVSSLYNGGQDRAQDQACGTMRPVAAPQTRLGGFQGSAYTSAPPSQSVALINGAHRAENTWEETATMVDDAVLDVVGLLDRCLHEKRFFDKAVFILTWGRDGGRSKVLQPYVCHLFDSVTGRMIDVLRATNGNTESGSWRDFEKMYESAHLSQEIQHYIKEGLRKLGFMCCFTDLKIDPENFLHWRLAKNGHSVKTLDRDVALRCLVVSL
ncbi:unnamed protein product [Ostreobium quekettii]|uniref:Potassium channel tetramerisation-type BTB domain-containing protein n=1 Tax=Ostreobium quekettii TaxID=121088 RepID=A0A8S1J639_9CHLO|nr:unnamed protein product [Ostreobium quekettii]|eukprot:evm.model.scf_859EXC.5 EVM.evm.TU.scf_859EXC.5   scf_859EXC:33527-35807(-)